MPIKVKYLDGGIGVLLTGYGTITGQDLILANQEIFSSIEKMKNYKYGLIDWSGATGRAIATADIKSAITQDKNASKYIPDGVIAVIAENDITFGLSRMWEIFIEHLGLKWETKIFRKRDEAERWIKEKMKEKHQIELTLK